MATSTFCDSVPFEEIALSVSSKFWSSQDHDRLDAFSPVSVVFDRDGGKIWDSPMSEEKLKQYMRYLRKSLDKIHRKVETSVKSSRASKRRNTNKKFSAVIFDKGD